KRCAVRMMRQAISPRLAISRVEIMRPSYATFLGQISSRADALPPQARDERFQDVDDEDDDEERGREGQEEMPERLVEIRHSEELVLCHDREDGAYRDIDRRGGDRSED